MPHDKRAEDVQWAEAILDAMEADVKSILEAFPTPPGTEPMEDTGAVIRRFAQMNEAQRTAFLTSRPGALAEIMRAGAEPSNGASPQAGVGGG